MQRLWLLQVSRGSRVGEAKQLTAVPTCLLPPFLTRFLAPPLSLSFYASLSIILLIIFMMDGEILMWEGLIMVLTYALYITFMVFNERMFNMCPAPEKEHDRSVPIDSDKNQVEMR